MPIDREIKTDLRNILSMVSCAEDYGFAGQIFFGFAAGLAGDVTNEELDEYAREVAAADGYGEEDYEEILETLKAWKATYVQSG